MTTIHVAAGLPPGHEETTRCRCQVLVFSIPGGDLIVHTTRSAEPLRPQEASHPDANYYQPTPEICAREGCGHARGFHWLPAPGAATVRQTRDGGCTAPGSKPRHCDGYVTPEAGAAAQVPDPAPADRRDGAVDGG